MLELTGIRTRDTKRLCGGKNGGRINQTITDQRSPSRHAGERFAGRRVFTLLLQLLQELWRQADVHGQRHALTHILQENDRQEENLNNDFAGIFAPS